MKDRPRVALLFPPWRIYRELAAACMREFAGLGFASTLSHRAGRGLLRADIVWIAGHAWSFTGLGRVLRTRRPGDARVVLWQMEPLPPPGISGEGLEIGRRAARWRYPHLVRPLRMLIEPARPFLRRLVEARQASVARPYVERIAADPALDGWGRCTPELLATVSREASWLERAARGGWVDHFFTTTRPRARFLRRLGVRPHLLPVGGQDVWGEPPPADAGRDIDVLLLAHLADPNRVDAARIVGEALAGSGRRLTVVDRGLYGEQRTRLLGRARVVLNVPRFPYDFPGMRMLMAMACGAPVLSEPCADNWPYRAGTHFEAAPLADLGGAAVRLLGDGPRRRELASEGLRFIRGPLSLRRLLARALRVVEREVPG